MIHNKNSVVSVPLATAFDWSRTLALVYLAFNGLKFVRSAGLKGVIKALGASVLGTVSAVMPGVVDSLMQGAVKKELDVIEKGLLGDGDPDAHMAMPQCGLSNVDILAKATVLKEKQGGFAEGIKWGGIYHDENKADGDSLGKLQHDLWGMFNNTNLLYPEVFPGIRKFEAETVQMVLTMVHGVDAGAVGLLSSGGTESILLAVLAYREQGRARGIYEPEIICGITAHPALYKACRYFGVKLIKIPVDATTAYQLSPEVTEAHITRNTVALYASAPTFTHGVMDPVQDLAIVARRHNVGLHVDNCLGGFLASYLLKIGAMDASKAFDFSVEGVTTISIDVHKYGFASKGV